MTETTARTRLSLDAGSQRAAIIDAQSGEEIGALEYEIGCPDERSVTIRRIELLAERRGWGHGSEAVRAFEEEMIRGQGVRRFVSGAPFDSGLALYFWLRLGYRPAAGDEVEWPSGAAAGSIAMVRLVR